MFSGLQIYNQIIDLQNFFLSLFSIAFRSKTIPFFGAAKLQLTFQKIQLNFQFIFNCFSY